MLDWTQIIVTAITICVPATVTLLTSNKLRRQANKHNIDYNNLTATIEYSEEPQEAVIIEENGIELETEEIPTS